MNAPGLLPRRNMFFGALNYKVKKLTGIKNASVLPDPVLAAPRTSHPLKASMIPSLCISVGDVYFALSRPGKKRKTDLSVE